MKLFFLKTWVNIDFKPILKLIQIEMFPTWKQVRTEEPSKLVCTVQDADKIKVLKEMNIAIEELKAITLEIHDNLDKIMKLAKNDGLLDKTVELVNPQVRLMWNMTRNNWSGVKLVANDFKFIGD